MSNPQSVWNELCTGAVLGTDRAGTTLSQTGGKLGSLLASLDTASAPARFLQSAAILSVYCRAGTGCPTARPETEEASHLDQNVARASAGRLLYQILEEGPADLLSEWCRLAATANVRAPDELLPTLLVRLARAPDQAQACGMLPVLGGRGRWLARKNPEWWAALLPFEDPDAAWQSGSLEQRVRALRCLRARNANQARELLEGVWGQEETNDRQKFLTQLEEGLSIDDAPFLETVLGEKSVASRRASAGLLSRLPASKYCVRMASRTAALVSIKAERGLLRRRMVIDVALPDSGDKAITSDGIEFKAKGKLGTKAHALLQMIAATPLSLWETKAGIEPHDLVSAAKKTEWSEVLIGGWSTAAATQRNEPWGEALLNEHFAKVDPQAAESEFDMPIMLMSLLDPAGREHVLAASAKKNGWGSAYFRALLRGCDHDWSNELSLTLIETLRKYLRHTKGGFDDGLRRLVTGWVVLHLNPTVAGEVATSLPSDESFGTRWLDDMFGQLASILNIRSQLHEEFRS